MEARVFEGAPGIGFCHPPIYAGDRPIEMDGSCTLGSIRPMWADSLVAQGFAEACGTSSGLDNIFGSDRISSAGRTIVSFWAEFHLRNSLSFQLFSFPISVKSED
jgi:hypothetical protein